MSHLFDQIEPPLADQIAEIKRELGYRDRVYPRWIAAGKMSQLKADCAMRDMRAALKSLERLELLGEQLTQATAR